MHSDPSRLTESVKEAMQSEAALGISVLSIWEVMVSIQKGRLHTNLPAEEQIDHWLRDIPLVRIPLNEQVIRVGHRMIFHHADPIDRFIAATAFCENSPLITADAHLLNLSWLKTIKAG